MEMRTRSQVRITGESCTRLYPPKKGGRKKKRMAETCGELFVEDGHAPSVGLARNVSAPSIDVQSPPGSKSKQGKKVVKPTGGTKGKEFESDVGSGIEGVRTPSKKLKGAANARAQEQPSSTSNLESEAAQWCPKIITSSRPCRITDIKPDLTQNQKQAIVEIGFGGLLQINTPELPGLINRWLLQHFNYEARAIMSDSGDVLYYITEEDVEDVFGLPNFPENPVSEVIDDRYREVREQFQVDHELPAKLNARTKLSELTEVMLRLDGGDDFKRLFVVYVVSGFLAPVANGSVDYRTLSATHDVSQIAHLDWCGFVLDKTCERASWLPSERPFSKQVTFSGCMMLLVINYCHRMIWQGIPQPTNLPLAANHSFQSLDKRLKREKASLGFGRLKVDLTTYPISKRPISAAAQATSVAQKRTVQFEIPSGLSDDAALKALVPNNYHRSVATLIRDLKLVVGDRFRYILTEDAWTEQHENPAEVAKTLTMLVDEMDDIMRHLEVSKEMLENQAEKLGTDAFYCTDDTEAGSSAGRTDQRYGNGGAAGSMRPTFSNNPPENNAGFERAPSVVPTSHFLSSGSEGYNNSDISAFITEHSSELPRTGCTIADAIEQEIANREQNMDGIVRGSQQLAKYPVVDQRVDSVTMAAKDCSSTNEDIYSSLEALNPGKGFNHTQQDGLPTLDLLDLLPPGINIQVNERIAVDESFEGIGDLNVPFPDSHHHY